MAMEKAPSLIGTPHAAVLIIDEDAAAGATMEMILASEGFVATVSHPGDAELFLNASCYSLILTDYYSSSAAESEKAALSLLSAADQVPVGCITSWSAIPQEIERRYAFKMMKPFDVPTFLATVAQFATVQIARPDQAEVIDRYFRALSDRNWKELVSLCADSVCYNLPGTHDLSRSISGRDAFRVYAEETFESFPKARFEVSEVSWLPHAAVASYRVSWEGGGNGVAVGTGAIYFRFLGPQIATIGVRTDIDTLGV